MVDNINIEKPLPIKTYNVSKVNEKLKRLEDAIESASGGITPEEVQTMIDTSIEGKQDVLTAGDGISIDADNVISLKGYSKLELTNLVDLKNWIFSHAYDTEILITYFNNNKRQFFKKDKVPTFEAPSSINEVSFTGFNINIDYNSGMSTLSHLVMFNTGYIRIYNDNHTLNTYANAGAVGSIQLNKITGLDGVPIDTTNIDTYIDSNGVCLKPFVVGSNNNASGVVLNVGYSSLMILNLSSSGITITNMSGTKIRNAIVNGDTYISLNRDAQYLVNTTITELSSITGLDVYYR